MVYAPPRPYEFSERDRDKDRFWPCPVSLALELKDLSGPAVSILPALAFQTFPGKEKDLASQYPHLAPPSEIRTPWTAISLRWLGALCGLDKGSVAKGLELLRERGFLQTGKIARPKNAGGFQTVVRLSGKLFAAKGEPKVDITGHLVFSGTWMLLPTHGARVVYLAVAFLSVVRNPVAFIEALERSHTPDAETVLEERRASNPISLAALQDVTGYTRSTVIESLSILTKPIFGPDHDGDRFGLVGVTEARGQHGYSYWLDSRADIWRFGIDALNVSAKGLQAMRDRQWPELAQHRKERLKAARARKRILRIRDSERIERNLKLVGHHAAV